MRHVPLCSLTSRWRVFVFNHNQMYGDNVTIRPLSYQYTNIAIGRDITKLDADNKKNLYFNKLESFIVYPEYQFGNITYSHQQICNFN